MGAYIIKELVTKGIPVRAIRRNSQLPSFIPASIFSGVDWREGDVLDITGLEESMDGIDTIIHSAAKVSHREGEALAEPRGASWAAEAEARSS